MQSGNGFQSTHRWLRLSLPCHALEALPAAKQQLTASLIVPSHVEAKTVRILIAEDDPTNRRLLSTLLNKLFVDAKVSDGSPLRLDLRVASDGQEAVRIITDAHTERFDLCLFDLHMPHCDGFEACRQVLDYHGALEDSLPPPRMVAITASARPSDHVRACSAGFDEVLAKPLRPGVLLQQLYACCETR
jgi:CheY-like chemotaxis protein